jgi:hypothetical protein
VVYAIKKSKDAKKAEGEEISIEEAKAIVANREFDKNYPTYFKDDVVVRCSINRPGRIIEYANG